MAVAFITGSGGLVGSEAVRFFSSKGFDVVGVDNDMRKFFFGDDASTVANVEKLKKDVSNYTHYSVDIRDKIIEDLFKKYQNSIKIIIHTAAQPSHDWAAQDPITDFSINAVGTSYLLELTRRYARDAVFIFTSTNKVYGDTPNELPLNELETRWEINSCHPYFLGIDEKMRVDQTKHSLFGVSKLAADVLVQEYGRYFGMKTVCFRGGCITGPQHEGVQLHGFLSYLIKCAMSGQQYTIFGYKGKQVRDNIHSFDLINAFWHFFQSPLEGEVYNIGGGRHSNCSVLEAIALCEQITGRKIKWKYDDRPRSGDHIWWISDIRKFRSHYPYWNLTYCLESIIKEIYCRCEAKSEPKRG